MVIGIILGLNLVATGCLAVQGVLHRRAHRDTSHLLKGNLSEHLAYVIGRAARSAAKDYLQDEAEKRCES